MYYNVQPAIPVYNYPQNQQVFPTINAPQPASYYQQPNPMMQGQVPMQQPQPGAQPYYPQPMPNGQLLLYMQFLEASLPLRRSP